MKKSGLLVLAGVGIWILSGCGGSGGSSGTVLLGSLVGPSAATQGLQVRVQKASDGFSEVYAVSSEGSFKARKLPEGTVSVGVEKATTGTSGSAESLSFNIELETGKTTEVEIGVLTWAPEPVGEFSSRLGTTGSYGVVRPIGPTGTTLQVTGDGSHVIETPDRLKVTLRTDGQVTVDESQYTGS